MQDASKERTVTEGADLPSILARLHRGWRRRWLAWATVYVAGFALLWAADLAQGWPFYGWAIGWALVKGLWDDMLLRRAMRSWRRQESEQFERQ